jgi:uncharacterized protein (DUF2461 family)
MLMVGHLISRFITDDTFNVANMKLAYNKDILDSEIRIKVDSRFKSTKYGSC